MPDKPAPESEPETPAKPAEEPTQYGNVNPETGEISTDQGQGDTKKTGE